MVGPFLLLRLRLRLLLSVSALLCLAQRDAAQVGRQPEQCRVAGEGRVHVQQTEGIRHWREVERDKRFVSNPSGGTYHPSVCVDTHTCVSDLADTQRPLLPVGHLLRLVQRSSQDLLNQQTEAFLCGLLPNQNLFRAVLSPVDLCTLNL